MNISERPQVPSAVGGLGSPTNEMRGGYRQTDSGALRGSSGNHRSAPRARRRAARQRTSLPRAASRSVGMMPGEMLGPRVVRTRSAASQGVPLFQAIGAQMPIRVACVRARPGETVHRAAWLQQTWGCRLPAHGFELATTLSRTRIFVTETLPAAHCLASDGEFQPPSSRDCAPPVTLKDSR